MNGGPRYVHVAGTNGKGSTAEYLASALGIGRACGLFTSPHILSPRERFRINGKMISQREYDAYLNREKEAADPDVPALWTQFGVWTRMALRWFEDRGTAYAVIETGLGGAKDQTNAVESRMQILTPISLDHTEILGDSVQKIAREKCGIIKWGSVVVSHPQAKEAMEVIRRACDRADARLIVLDERAVRVHRADMQGQSFDFRYGALRLRNAHIRAIAPMQVYNACVAAIAACELGVSEQEILRGLEQTRIPARAQAVDGALVDAAHNPAAMRELASVVKRHYAKKHVTVLIAVMGDKDVREITRLAGLFANSVVCTCADKKRGLPAKDLAQFFDNAQTVEDPTRAFLWAREISIQKKGALVVCGSFYLAARALEAMGEKPYGEEDE